MEGCQNPSPLWTRIKLPDNDVLEGLEPRYQIEKVAASTLIRRFGPAC